MVENPFYSYEGLLLLSREDSPDERHHNCAHNGESPSADVEETPDANVENNLAKPTADNSAGDA